MVIRDHFIFLWYPMHEVIFMFNIKDEEIKKLYDTHLISKKPLKLKEFPTREKRKFIILGMLVHLFEPGKVYKEKEVNEILSQIHLDYAVLRRYLVDYKFMKREVDGSAYTLSVNPNEYTRFKIDLFIE